MKKILFLIILLISARVNAQERGIHFFHGTLTELKAEAKKQNKLIFIDCFTTWCGPCNMMARDIFPRLDVGDFYNQHFVCYKLDMEKGEGLSFAKDYNVHSYPTFLYIDANGEQVHRTLGSREAGDFLKDGENASSPDNNLRALTARFKKGDRDTAMLKKLIRTSLEADLGLSEEAVTAYWAAIPEEKIVEKENWDVFKYAESNIDSKMYKYVFSHRGMFLTKYPKSEIEDALYSKAAEAMRTAADKKDDVLFKKAKTIAMLSDDKAVLKMAGNSELRFYRKTNQWDQYISFADEFLSKYGDNEREYNSVAWEIVANTDNKPALEKALVYADKSMKLGKNYGNTDTYANVLWKLGKKKEAEAACLDAIELAKAEKLDYTSTQEVLDKVRAGKTK